MYEAAFNSAVEITVMGVGAIVIQRASIAAMIDPAVPGVLYGIAAVLVAAAKLIRAIYAVEQPENWLEKKLKRLNPKKGRQDDRNSDAAK